MKIKARKTYLRQQNLRYTEALDEIPREEWPTVIPDNLSRAYRSNQFFVQIYELPNGVVRLTACRTEVDGDDWKAGISWDNLQDLKRRLGFADKYAIEVYPREVDLVNVANLRHLWILPEPLEVGWFKDSRGETTKGAAA